jgi:REP-associated tyrosine transposase
MLHRCRANVARASYFFTVNLADRRTGLLLDHIDALHEALRRVRREYPFRFEAFVVLPDHLHALWTLGFVTSPRFTGMVPDLA